MAVQNKKFGPGILHGRLTEMVDEKGNVRRLATAVPGRDRDGMATLVGKEHLETPTEIGGIGLWLAYCDLVKMLTEFAEIGR